MQLVNKQVNAYYNDEFEYEDVSSLSASLAAKHQLSYAVVKKEADSLFLEAYIFEPDPNLTVRERVNQKLGVRILNGMLDSACGRPYFSK